MIDYKISRETVNDDGTRVVLMRFYEGAVTTENETNVDGKSEPVTRYRRTKYLGEKKIRVIDADVPRDTVIKSMNIELKTVADDRKVSAITEQTDISLQKDITKVEEASSLESPVVKTRIL